MVADAPTLRVGPRAPDRAGPAEPEAPSVNPGNPDEFEQTCRHH
ncbi:hypothetical protein Rhow_000602 [Rhodococcus wratislaviensis]|uniref:Uncharacterized protein n=1 Tax=Rhodococcus wratislaviensis TaxID=44752 RepID=A0A402C2F4_RHOWR|nr:hypothetical protein Rhow_000602 [Rhodococcus wratislaviensis]